MSAPDRLWCWNFQTEEGSWEKGWGGYARPILLRALAEGERNTGAVYIRADLADARLERAVRATLEAAAQMVDCGCDKAQKAAVIAAKAPNGVPRWMACGEANCGAIDAAAILALDPAQIVKEMKDE